MLSGDRSADPCRHPRAGGSVRPPVAYHRPVPVKRQAVDRPSMRERFANRSKRQGVPEPEQFHPGYAIAIDRPPGYKLHSRLRPGKETPPGSSSDSISQESARDHRHTRSKVSSVRAERQIRYGRACVSVSSSIAPDSIFRNRHRDRRRLPSRACCRQGGTRGKDFVRHVRPRPRIAVRSWRPRERSSVRLAVAILRPVKTEAHRNDLGTVQQGCRPGRRSWHPTASSLHRRSPWQRVGRPG